MNRVFAHDKAGIRGIDVKRLNVPGQVCGSTGMMDASANKEPVCEYRQAW